MNQHLTNNRVTLPLVEIARRGGAIKRYHVHPYVIGQQTVAQHSFNMVWMLYAFHPNPAPVLVKAVLGHDVPEAICGDVAKWSNPAVCAAVEEAEQEILVHYGIPLTDDLPEEDQNWLRALDMVEGLCFARDQRVMGNEGFDVVFKSYLEHCVKARESDKWPWSPDLARFVSSVVVDYVLMSGRKQFFPEW